MKTRTKIKVLKFLGLRPCRKKEKFKDCPNIYQHRKISHSEFPPNWLEKISFICSDGTTITYNPVSNTKATDEALKQLKMDANAGETLNKDIIDNSKMPK